MNVENRVRVSWIQRETGKPIDRSDNGKVDPIQFDQTKMITNKIDFEMHFFF